MFLSFKRGLSTLLSLALVAGIVPSDCYAAVASNMKVVLPGGALAVLPTVSERSNGPRTKDCQKSSSIQGRWKPIRKKRPAFTPSA